MLRVADAALGVIGAARDAAPPGALGAARIQSRDAAIARGDLSPHDALQSTNVRRNEHALRGLTFS